MYVFHPPCTHGTHPMQLTCNPFIAHLHGHHFVASTAMLPQECGHLLCHRMVASVPWSRLMDRPASVLAHCCCDVVSTVPTSVLLLSVWSTPLCHSELCAASIICHNVVGAPLTGILPCHSCCEIGTIIWFWHCWTLAHLLYRYTTHLSLSPSARYQFTRLTLYHPTTCRDHQGCRPLGHPW